MKCKCGEKMGYIMSTVDDNYTEQLMYTCRGCGRTGYHTKEFERDHNGFCTDMTEEFTYSEPRPDKVAKWKEKEKEQN